MKETFEIRKLERPLRGYANRFLCASGVVLSLSVGSPATVFSAETQAAVGDLPLRGNIIQSDHNSPQSPTVNTGDVRVVVPGTALDLYLTTEIAADETVKGDEFFARISKDVTVDGRVVLPRGTKVHGVLSALEGPKSAGRNGYINARFDYLITPDGRQVPIQGDSTTRDSKGKAAAKVVGRAAGYTAVGGVVGTVMGLQLGGLAGAAVSHGGTVAGGAAIGGAAGLTMAMLMKGEAVSLPPGSEMHVKLNESLQLPTMTMPDESAEDFSISGLRVAVTRVRINRPEISLLLDLSNETENSFSRFDIGLEDETGNVFFPSPPADADMWVSKIKPGSRFTSNITFNVDNAKSRQMLVIFKPFSREPLAKLALTDAMLASNKTNAKEKRAEK